LDLKLRPRPNEFLDIDSLKEKLKHQLFTALDRFWSDEGLKDDELYVDMVLRWTSDGIIKPFDAKEI